YVPSAQLLVLALYPLAYCPAPSPHARLPAAAAVRDARVGGPAFGSASLGAPVRALGHTSARLRRALFGADHAVALPAILRGGAPAPSAPHRAAPGLPRHGRHHVVAGAVTPARAAAGELRHAAPVSLRTRAPDVARGR